MLSSSVFPRFRVLTCTIRHCGPVRNRRAEAIPLPHVLLPNDPHMHSTAQYLVGAHKYFGDSCNNYLQLFLAIVIFARYIL